MINQFLKIGFYALAGLWTVTLNYAGAEEETMAVFPMSAKSATCIRVQAGQKFSLKFSTSPGTGYGWELAAPIDEKLLAILETKIEDSASGLPGASASEFWLCRALTAGETEIALKYVRPWEKDTEPLKKHVFKVKIH